MRKKYLWIFFFVVSFQLYGESVRFYEMVISNALALQGRYSFPATNGNRFTSDCIGFVRYVYYLSGIDLMEVYGKGRGGVSSLYDGLVAKRFVYTNRVPLSVGDLIFFDNTYDVNKNGKWDDPLSHVAIVVSVDAQGTITYIHHSPRKGVSQDYMNLYYPQTYAFRKKDRTLKVINSYLRIHRGEQFPRENYISSFFFRAFAHIPVREISE
ncbi:NlpC/P60 family protein [Thermospira aquatica]|uniref:C40 family peptidase n=1 Tax=Thermospira aquatica TaxID=2828656 RepID=A0AAX3BFN2_9SPIR|nr:NlpC/P60 family protein [Thermospira aquatica]URA10975.1 C40 family peptidase [Thermospira aquatica]